MCDPHPTTSEPCSLPDQGKTSVDSLDVLRALARALGRQAARQTWAEAAQPSVAAPSPEATLPPEPSKRSGGDHAAG